MFNLFTEIAGNPTHYKQFRCGESLLSIYNCPLKSKYEDTWSQYNYIIYVVEGRKIWHMAHGSYDLREGSCVFVRKGATIVEQFFETRFCFFLFFVPDEFICEVLKSKATPLPKPKEQYEPVITISKNAATVAFFQTMMIYFNSDYVPDQYLLKLKFSELILTIADNPDNSVLQSYFSSILKEPQSVALQRIMEDNFCFNLKLEVFARLSNRSLSAYKRDFLRLYHTTPGKWLLEKRLHNAKHLLSHLGKTVAEAAYESGFENVSHFSRAYKKRFDTSPATMLQKKLKESPL